MLLEAHAVFMAILAGGQDMIYGKLAVCVGTKQNVVRSKTSRLTDLELIVFGSILGIERSFRKPLQTSTPGFLSKARAKEPSGTKHRAATRLVRCLLEFSRK